MPLPHALLLIGPTGSGKTPLGELLDRRGLWGRQCEHFDFGASLRRIATGDGPPGLLAPGEVDFLRGVLRAGALLEDRHFHIAEAILRAFLAERRVGPGELVVLNGLPRHADQADDVGTIVSVRAIVELACADDAVLARIAADAGGDRARRTDDDGRSVREKLAIYRTRTAGLLGYYRRRGAAVLSVDVGPTTSAEEARDALERMPAPQGV